jgi:transposase
MKNHNTIGVDLAKNVIQVCAVTPRYKQLHNKALSRKKFSEYLTKQKPGLVTLEACATAHYWARFAQAHGHEVKILPALAVYPFTGKAQQRCKTVE